MTKEEYTDLGDKVEGHHLALFGPEGRTGLSGCIKKKVSWTQLGSLVMAICIIFGAYNLYAIEKRDKRLEKVESCSVLNRERVRVVEENIKNIQTDQSDIKTNVKQIQQDMVKKSDLDAKFDQIIKAIEKK